MVESRILRLGMVGARRTRQGTGPFLASFLEEAGCAVVGVAGHGADSAAAAAAALAARLGHPVSAQGSVEALLACRLDGLVIATPDAAHLAALRAAAAAGTEPAIAVLCEKPLVPAEDLAAVAPLLDAFRRRGILLMEACQWPEALAAMDVLYPDREKDVDREVRRFAMRLSPAEPGPSMLLGSLSHFLSVIQVAWPVAADCRIEGLRYRGTCGVADGLEVAFVLRNHPSEGGRAACRLELAVCADQPRPAWVEIDGRRMVRVVDPDTYAISFAGGDRTISVGDPTRALVYRFAELVRNPSFERNRTESHRVAHRARLYSHIVRGLREHLAD